MSRVTPDILKTHAKWFAANLKRLRKFRGFSQSALATAVGVEVDTVQAWERCAEYPTGDGHIQLCTVLQCQAAHLYNHYSGSPFNVLREPDAYEQLTYTEAAVRAKRLFLVSEDEWNALTAENAPLHTNNVAAERDALRDEVVMLRGRLESINALSGK